MATVTIVEPNLAELKKFNQAYLMTPKGREDLAVACQFQKEWMNIKDGSVATFKTSGVKLDLVDERLRSKITKLTVYPIGLNNHCHNNSKRFEELGYNSRLGFNLTCCPCGKFQSYELHTVNEKDGKLYDFTKDFDGEKEKYFLNIGSKSITAWSYMDFIGGSGYYCINKGCKCKFINLKNLSPDIKRTNSDDFVDLIENLSRVMFIC